MTDRIPVSNASLCYPLSSPYLLRVSLIICTRRKGVVGTGLFDLALKSGHGHGMSSPGPRIHFERGPMVLHTAKPPLRETPVKNSWPPELVVNKCLAMHQYYVH